uniref:Uncharacterized protein n=1 Tax=Arundo donax TaxID=35708 RepID=A0A0A9GRH6_ARUDO
MLAAAIAMVYLMLALSVLDLYIFQCCFPFQVASP